MVLYILVGIFLGILAGVLAANKGRFIIGWALLCLIFPPAIIFIMALSSKKPVIAQQ